MNSENSHNDSPPMDGHSGKFSINKFIQPTHSQKMTPHQKPTPPQKPASISNAPATDNHASLLHFAVERNDTGLAKTLIQAGADVNKMDGNGNTPLHLAVYLGKPEIIKLLIEAGANVNIDRKSERTFKVIKKERSTEPPKKMHINSNRRENLDGSMWRGVASNREFIHRTVLALLGGIALVIFIALLFWLCPQTIIFASPIFFSLFYVHFVKLYVPYIQCQVRRVHAFGWSGGTSVIFFEAFGAYIVLLGAAYELGMGICTMSILTLLQSLFLYFLIYMYILRPYYSSCYIDKDDVKDELKKELIRCGFIFLAGIASGYLLPVFGVSDFLLLLLCIILGVICLVFSVCRIAVFFTCCMDIQSQPYRESVKILDKKKLPSNSVSFDKIPSCKPTNGKNRLH